MDVEELQPTPTKQKLVYKELFKDRPLISLIFAGILMAGAVVIKVLLSISQYDIDIPVKYTQFGVDSYISGDWFTHYNFAVFAAILVLINTLVALRIYRHRRWVSVSLLTMQLIILTFLFVVSWAIIGTLPVAG